MPDRLTRVGIPLSYALCAALWIIVSGYVLATGVDDPVLQGRIEIGKGLLFVAGTSVLLYLLLGRLGTRKHPRQPFHVCHSTAPPGGGGRGVPHRYGGQHPPGAAIGNTAYASAT